MRRKIMNTSGRQKNKVTLYIVLFIFIYSNSIYSQIDSLKTEHEIIKKVIGILFYAQPRVSGEMAYAYTDYLVELMLIAPEIFFEVAAEHDSDFKLWLDDIQIYFWYVKEDITYEELVKKTEQMIERLNHYSFDDEREEYKLMVIKALKELQERRKSLDNR
ncbi:MAG: hypothetical protein DRP15_03430 [Candidatus Aenigmatarchaeota archaeon]|nr:MAG: hypothetical protein DRP15_03430 [Candidatus Aenigmarchaeota archaeon]